MSTETTVTRSAEDFAKNYKRFGNGLAGPIAIANINVFDKETGESEAYDSQKHAATIAQFNAKKSDTEEGYKGYSFKARIFVNLAMKTENSGGKNAVYTMPVTWNLKWRTGDYVCVEVVGGYAQKLIPATAMKAKEIADPVVNKAIAEAQAEESEGAEDTQDEAAEEKSVEVTDETEDDQSF